MRVRQREKAYSIAELKEYLPEYDSRLAYVEKRTESELRRTPLRDRPGDPRTSATAATSRSTPSDGPQAAVEEGEKATVKLNVLLEIQKRLESLKPSSATASPRSAGRPTTT